MCSEEKTRDIIDNNCRIGGGGHCAHLQKATQQHSNSRALSLREHVFQSHLIRVITTTTATTTLAPSSSPSLRARLVKQTINKKTVRQTTVQQQQQQQQLIGQLLLCMAAVVDNLKFALAFSSLSDHRK